MACEAVIDFLTRETGRFEQEIYSRLVPTSPWVALIRKAGWPEGMGETISSLVYERSQPLEAAPTWTTMAVSDGAEGGMCLPAATKIGIASTTRSFTLARRVLEGPDICAEELRSPFAVAKQVDNVLRIITEYARTEWEIKARHDYLTLAARKWVVGAASETEGTSTGWPAACPGGTLGQGILNRAKVKLLRDGAASSALGQDGGSPVLTLVCSPETSDKLIFDNADIRQDLRYGKPSELLAGFGVERSYRGFFHLLDLFPLRYECSEGTYTEVAAWTSTAATKGTKSIVNSSYEGATYEASFIFSPSVFTWRIPRPITSSGSNTRFNALNYTVGAGGSWKLQNIVDRVCNPDGTIVYHRGHLACSPEPVEPWTGMALAHLRCDPARGSATSCT